MSDDLKSDLTSIDGVGEATADKIMAILDGYDSAEHPYLQKARDAAERGDYREAGVYLQRAGGE